MRITAQALADAQAAKATLSAPSSLAAAILQMGAAEQSMLDPIGRSSLAITLATPVIVSHRLQVSRGVPPSTSPGAQAPSSGSQEALGSDPSGPGSLPGSSVGLGVLLANKPGGSYSGSGARVLAQAATNSSSEPTTALPSNGTTSLTLVNGTSVIVSGENVSVMCTDPAAAAAAAPADVEWGGTDDMKGFAYDPGFNNWGLMNQTYLEARGAFVTSGDIFRLKVPWYVWIIISGVAGGGTMTVLVLMAVFLVIRKQVKGKKG